MPDLPGTGWLWASLAASFGLSAAVTWSSVGYARRRNLIDEPGRRRSHALPTPRGGGIGIVVAVVSIFAVEMACLPREALPDLGACLGAILLVAAVGWIDDHGSLAARWRLLAHFIAAGLVLFALSREPSAPPPPPSAVALAVGMLLAVALVWSINLHNFMDGIDGILALQAIFVFATMAWLCARAGADADAVHLGTLAAAAAGFLPFNFPRARVFMGDVGSGVLGLLVGISALRLLAVDGIEPASAVIVVSAFVIDATCNLASRMWRGRRWYSAHREHLYQWMTRAGMTHARVVAWYLGWNLLVVVPALWLVNRALPATPAGPPLPGAVGLTVLAVVYGGGVAVWVSGKRWCLRKVQSRRHAPA